MKKIVCILNGMGGSGKDTFANFVADIIPSKHISIVEPPKKFARLMGWDGGKSEKDRKFLYELKHLMDVYNDYNFQYVREEVEKFKADDNTNILFVDMRELYQIKRAKSEFDAVTVFIVRNNIKMITTNSADSQTLEDYQYDIYIDNNSSLEDLKEEAMKFVISLKVDDYEG